ncbi:hypothetical protein RB195_025665 [Necator americanus]|uniref:Uncharacterized protein n=2 Tax=Necator americanus TaxID=51031 RepID=A0ABR1EVE3_NECAM|nr:hypothetical protein NECAME_01755 [Necator americanus]ETN83448.1 hypothetical protein NECAME_01755 [Necator americanus]
MQSPTMLPLILVMLSFVLEGSAFGLDIDLEIGIGEEESTTSLGETRPHTTRPRPTRKHVTTTTTEDGEIDTTTP